MAAPSVSVAPWCTLADLPERVSSAKYEIDLSATGEAFDWIQVASDILFHLTRNRWPGVQSKTIRPILEGSSALSGRWAGSPVVAHRWGTTSPEGVSEIVLPNAPVTAVTEVLVDGAVVPSSRYRVDGFSRLVLLPQSGDTLTAWPAWQDLDAASTEKGTWQVTYSHGTLPPEGGKRACAELAADLAISASPKVAGTSRLPERPTSVVRQGVTAALQDPLTVFADGYTGVKAVDLWIASVNRGSSHRQGRVHRLGKVRSRRTT